jgi:uncharacterized protein
VSAVAEVPPLPRTVDLLRTAIYPHLAPVANRREEAMGLPARYPASHAEFIERCRAAGQTRPTPLLLQYGVGDFNCLHRELSARQGRAAGVCTGS